MYVLTLLISERLLVPLPPSSMMNSSPSTIAAPISVAPSISRFDTENAPPAAPIYVLTVDAVIFLLVPPAPSSTMNKSASARAAPISVPPSMSNADNEILLAVDIVDNLLSAIEPAN